MKLKVLILEGILFAALAAGCASPQVVSPAAGKPVNPGDQVGGQLVTTGDVGEMTYLWNKQCVKEGIKWLCELEEGQNLNVSVAVYDYRIEELDKKWEGSTYELSIDDRPVNLKAFGPIDFDHPITPSWKMRAWNVVLEDLKPGTFTLHDKGTVDGETFDDTTVITVVSK